MKKYFASTLNKNKLPELATHWMLGHRIDSVTEAYFKAGINSPKKEYMKAMQDLSFEKVEVKKVTTPEYDTLIQELRDEMVKRKTCKNRWNG